MFLQKKFSISHFIKYGCEVILNEDKNEVEVSNTNYPNPTIISLDLDGNHLGSARIQMIKKNSKLFLFL